MFTSVTSVPYVILSMTLLNVSATLGIVTTRIGSNAEVSAECFRGGVVWITKMQRALNSVAAMDMTPIVH